MNYSQAEEYLHSFTNYENIPGISYISPDYSLRHIDELLHRMGDPHLAAKTVHIAGTKGKGSIAAMVAQVLTVSGYKTGLYTSPHLHTLRERIRVNGSLISQSEFAALVTEVKPYLEAINHNSLYRRLTFFEALTVLALAYFKHRKVDFQVLEVGLGGRLDATNVVKPNVCVITPISLDHTNILGDSLDKIAYEKAGIIKAGCMVVSSPQPDEVTSVINKVCHQLGAKLIQVGKDVTWCKIDTTLHHQSFIVKDEMGSHCFTIPLLGDFQVENAATAVATLKVLASQNFNISLEDMSQGLAKVEWPGRFQILSHHPIVVVDGAHNVASIKRLVENIKAYFNYDQIFLIFGVACDKDIAGIVRELTQLSPRVVVTHASSPRAASPLILAAEFAKWGIRTRITETVSEALSQAISRANKKSLVCVTGSLFVVAEALDYVTKNFQPPKFELL